MQKQYHRIHSPELAHQMGYAEKPFRDLAALAIAVGMQEFYDKALSNADRAGVVAGREYVNSMHRNLSHYDSVPLGSAEGKLESKLPGLSKARLVDYAKERGIGLQPAGRTYNAIARTVEFDETPFTDALRQKTDIMYSNVRYKIDHIPVDVLLAALREVIPERPEKEGPSQDLLRTNFTGIGPRGYNLIVGYCNNVIEQADSEQP